MHNRWQPLVVMALALTIFSFHNKPAAQQSATTTTTPPTTSRPPTTTEPTTTSRPTTTEPTTTTTSTTTPPGGQGQPGGGQPGGQGQPGGGQPGQQPGGAEQASSHRVVPGDNLWTIARDHLAEVRGRLAAELSDREIAVYWLKVIKANRARLKSGDPDLIYPGERTVLPPVAAAPAQSAPETRVQVSHVVVAGENLWTIARDHLARARSGADEPTTREVAAYWLRVVEANRNRLRSGDPDLIYPGERTVLPPVE
jgi:nucleoid-associated protein YgaU